MDNKPIPSPFDEMMQTVLDEIRRTLDQVSWEELEALVREVTQAKRIFVSGSGRTGLVMKGYAMRLAQLGLPVHVAGETTTPAVRSEDLLLIGSGSGVTESQVRYAEKAVEAGARVVAVTADAESPVARLAGVVVVIPASTPKSSKEINAPGLQSRQPMGTLFEQSLGVMFDASVMLLMRQQDETERSMFARHANLE